MADEPPRRSLLGRLFGSRNTGQILTSPYDVQGQPIDVSHKPVHLLVSGLQNRGTRRALVDAFAFAGQPRDVSIDHDYATLTFPPSARDALVRSQPTAMGNVRLRFDMEDVPNDYVYRLHGIPVQVPPHQQIYWIAADLPTPHTLLAAVNAGDVDWLKRVLDSRSDIDLDASIGGGDTEGMTLLHVAAEEGREGVLRELLGRGANASVQSWTGEAPLHQACHFDNDGCITALLDADAAWNAKDENGWTPLHLAATWSSTESLAALLEGHAHTPSINAVTTDTGETPLMRLLLRGADDDLVTMVAMLLDSGASCLDSEVFCRAARLSGDDIAVAAILKSLCDACSGVVPDVSGDTPLIIALEAGNVDGARVMLEDGHAGVAWSLPLCSPPTDPNQLGEAETALTLVMGISRPLEWCRDAIDLLVGHGADPDKRNRRGKSAWDVGIEKASELRRAALRDAVDRKA